MNSIKLIPISGKKGHGLFSKIDEEDYKLISPYKWYISCKPNARTKYAITSVWNKQEKKYQTLFMHRLIMNASDKTEVDHIDHDGLNNQKLNLRLCTSRENSLNKISVLNSTSKYLGVKHLKKSNYWSAKIVFNNKPHYLGTYKQEMEAAEAYNKAAKKYFGDFANLNIIENDFVRLGKNKIVKSSKYIGVCFNKKLQKWAARIVINRKTINIGIYEQEAEAAQAYNTIAIKYKKQLNIITEKFTIKGRCFQSSSSIYKGVSYVKAQKLYRARVKFNKKEIFIGKFKSETDAAIAYNKKAIELFGEKAKLNIIK